VIWQGSAGAMPGASAHNAVSALLAGLTLILADAAKVGIGIHSLQTGSLPLPGEQDTYLIASFPKAFTISYARLPDPTWRPLIISGLRDPSAVAVDPQNNRLYVSDPVSNIVYWYQLKVELPSKYLTTDGVQHVAAKDIAVQGMAVNQAGDLYMSGRPIVQAPDVTRDAVYKKAAADLATDDKGATRLTRLWTAGDGSWISVMTATGPSTVIPMSPSTPQMFRPGPIAVDMYSLYWGNIIKGSASSLAKAANTVPAPLAGSAAAASGQSMAAMPLANNSDAVTGIAITTSGVFFAGRPSGSAAGIFGMTNDNLKTGCIDDESDSCIKRVAEIGDPGDLVWDGGSNLYVTDHSTGAVQKVAAEQIGRHELEMVTTARGIKSLAIFQAPSGAVISARPLATMLVLCLVLSRLD